MLSIITSALKSHPSHLNFLKCHHLLANNDSVIQVHQPAKAHTVSIAIERAANLLSGSGIAEDPAAAAAGDDVSTVSLDSVSTR